MGRLLRCFVILLLVGVAAAGLIAFAPAQLGGRAAYVTVRGASMEPSLHAGDFVVVRRSGSYEVGDAVAYRSKQLDATVLHRITAKGSDGFVLRGDNNDFTDPDRPTDEDIVGKLWIRVPAAGRLLAAGGIWPFAAAVLVLVAVPATKLTRQRRRTRGPRTLSRSSVRVGATAAFAVVAAASAVLAWGAPMLATRQAGAATFTHVGRVDYSASTDKTAVYADGAVDTGDPVFLSLVPQVEARLTYRFDTDTSAGIDGTASLTALLTNTDGLSVEVPLATAPVRSGAADLTGTLDAAGLWAQVQAFASATSTGGSSAVVTLSAVVDVHGTVGGSAIEERFDHDVVFDLDRVRMRVAGSELGRGATELTAQRAGEAPRIGQDPDHVTVAGQQVPLGPARAATTGAAFAGVIAAVGLYRAHRRRACRRDPLHRHADRVVVADAVTTDGNPIADLAVVEAIGQLAEALDQPILRVTGTDADVLFVVVPGVVYRHRLPRPDGPAVIDEALLAALPYTERAAAVLSSLAPEVEVRRGGWLDEFALDHVVMAPAGLLAVRSVDGDRIRGTDDLTASDGLRVQAYLAGAGARRLQRAMAASGAPDVALVAAVIRWDDPDADATADMHGTVVLNGYKAAAWISDLTQPLVEVADRLAFAAAADRHIETSSAARDEEPPDLTSAGSLLHVETTAPAPGAASPEPFCPGAALAVAYGIPARTS